MAIPLRQDLHVPLGVQLFWQLRYQISTGEFQPGERLPTVRELAAALRVNANTIRNVYQRLQEEGWVVARRKIGTVVADPLPADHQVELEAVVEQAFAAAAAHGISPDTLAAAAFAQAAQCVAPDARNVVFCECTIDGTEAYRRVLEDALGAQLESLQVAIIDDLPRLLANGGVDAVITTAWHAGQVRALLNDVPLVTLMAGRDYIDAVHELGALTSGSTVVVISPSPEPRRNVMEMIADLSPGLRVLGAVTPDDPAVATADLVIAWARDGAPMAVEGKRTLWWGPALEPTAITQLRRQLGLYPQVAPTA